MPCTCGNKIIVSLSVVIDITVIVNISNVVAVLSHNMITQLGEATTKQQQPKQCLCFM